MKPRNACTVPSIPLPALTPSRLRKAVPLLLACMLLPLPFAYGKAALWLFPERSAKLALTDAYYADPNYNNEEDPYEPMLTESYVVIGPAYTLDIYNHGKEVARTTQLVISLNDISAFNSITINGTLIDATAFTHGIPTYHSGEPMPPHGVFPTHFALYTVGTIPPGGMAKVQVTVNGTVGLKVHFDAFAAGVKGKKKFDIVTPFSHDFTGIHYGHDVELNKSDVMIQDWEGMPPSTYLSPPAPPGMPTPFNPVIDGAFSFPAEWWYASVRTNMTNSGSIYRQNQLNWVATSVQTGNQMMYPGITLFDLHNFWAANTLETADYNIFSMPYAGHTVTAWVFMAGDEQDDSFWLPHAQGLALSHLIPEGTGTNQIIDEGFIVRLDGDPTTDRHWFPGMPEPGDPGWVWLHWYGYFGRAGYNDSGWQSGVYCTAPGIHEVYEMAFHPPFADDPGGPPPPLKRCYTIEWVPTYSDPHNGSPQQYMPVIVLLGPGHVDKPLSPPPPLPPDVPWPPQWPYYEIDPEQAPVWIDVIGEPVAVEGEPLELLVLGESMVPDPQTMPITLLATFATEHLDTPGEIPDPPPPPIAQFDDLGGGIGVFVLNPPPGTAGTVFEVKFKAVNPFFQNGLGLRIPIMPSVWGP